MAKSKLTPKQRDEAVKMYAEGATTTEVCAVYGINSSSMSSLLRSRGVKARTHHYSFDEGYFDMIDSEQKAYFLGFLYADGYNNDAKYVVKMFLHPRDASILEAFAKAINYKGELKTEHRKNGKIYNGLVLNSKRFSLACTRAGVFRRKSKTLRFPMPEQVPTDLLRHFFRGYFDGDGWIVSTEKSKEVGFISSDSFIFSAKLFLDMYLGVDSKVRPHRSEGMSLLRYSNRCDIQAFMDWIYKGATVYLPRKRASFLSYQASFKYRDRKCPNIVLSTP